MPWQFKKHYTREEAEALLPQVRRWLERIQQLRRLLLQSDQRIESLLAGGHEIGGNLVNQAIRHLAELKQLLREFSRRDIYIKDVDRGLVDFPAIVQGREVFLCWEQDEEQIEFWHDIESGYSGRERLD